jgi:hypothetical protein
VADESEKKTVTLSEEESTMLKYILRSSRRDIQRINIVNKGEKPIVAIEMFALKKVELPYQEAIGMGDDEWQAFFAKHPPLI